MERTEEVRIEEGRDEKDDEYWLEASGKTRPTPTKDATPTATAAEEQEAHGAYWAEEARTASEASRSSAETGREA